MHLERGQVAVVTGGASGLGRALARQFAERGLSLVLGDVEKGPLDETVAAFEADGVQVLGVATDVRFADQVDALAAATLERFGRVDVVCNNAGVGTMSGATWELPIEDWKWVMEVNLDGVLHGIRSFVPHLVAQGSGQVVNTASMAGISSGPSMAPYLVSKHAVVALSQGLRDELAETAPAVGVTIVCPGTMATNIGNSERTRPAELSRPASPHDATRLDGFPIWIDSITEGEPMPADDAAAIVVEAVEAGREFAYPNGGMAGAHAWLDRIGSALPTQ
jgi:NAD(P)-dependent dehydrogenase (short-subunit alcohol dehydrogenase family)